MGKHIPQAGELLFDHFIDQVVAVVEVKKPYLFLQVGYNTKPVQAYPWYLKHSKLFSSYRFFTLDGKPVGEL